MSYFSVAIVGRPNVGKSTLFNRLVGSRIAIEAPTSGVTRDRLLYPLRLEDPDTGEERTFDLIDTGGIGVVDKQKLEADVEKQIDIAIEQATVILFIVDIRDEVTPLDSHVADRLRRVKKPIILVANKADTDRIEDMPISFHSLGLGEIIPVSAKHNRNIGALEEAILRALPPKACEGEGDDTRGLLRIAFAGKRNVGKSTIINQIAGGDRVIVSDVPGTTRDAIDIIIERDGEKFVAIDTAGMRKRGQMDDVMEFFGHIRTEKAICRADVVILMLDATEEISKVDKRIGQLVVDEAKPCIVVLNKWDLVQEKNPGVKVADFQEYIADRLPGLWFCRLAGVSAKDGVNVWQLIKSAKELAEMSKRTVNTGAINSAIAEAQKRRRPRAVRGKVGKIYYGTMTGTTPPTFSLFCNNPSLFDKGFMRFLENSLRKSLGYGEIPLQLVLTMSKEKQLGRYS